MSRFNVMPRAYRQQLAAKDAEKIARIVGENEDNKTYANTPAGDARKLRGIPAVGPSVTGAIPGTRPGDTLR